MYDLSQTTIISFEIGSECNLSAVHPQCPINLRKMNAKKEPVTIEDILQAITEAEQLGFRGSVAFHNYNEPLLYIDRILEVIKARSDLKYLLWTNGTLLSPNIEENDLLSRFNQVAITCYYKEMLPFFKELKEHYGNIDIVDWELDDRLEAYSREYTNEIGCRRPFFDMPIDYYGNIYLCCMDWDNRYKIGNIKTDGLMKSIQGEAYQEALHALNRKLLDRNHCPEICTRCDKRWLWYPKPTET